MTCLTLRFVCFSSSLFVALLEEMISLSHSIVFLYFIASISEEGFLISPCYYRDTKGTFHAKMGIIKDRNGMDLTEAEDIKKRWQEYSEELYKKDLLDPDNHDGVITHLEPDILECEVKWSLGSNTPNKDSGGDVIPVELFQILKDDAVKELHSICQQIWKTQQWPQDWKRSVFIPIPKKGNAFLCSMFKC